MVAESILCGWKTWTASFDFTPSAGSATPSPCRDMALIGGFSLQGEALTGGRFLVDQGDREAAAGVAGGGPGVVLLSTGGSRLW